MINLRLSVYDLDEHAQKWMKRHGITYKKAVPQMMGDQWWFFDCQNVPEKIEKPLSILEGELESFIGYGLSKEDVEELNAGWPENVPQEDPYKRVSFGVIQQPKQEPAQCNDSKESAVWLTEEETLETRTSTQYLNSLLTYKFGNPDDLVSKAEVDRIVEDALYRLKAQVAKAVFDNDYMWDDLAELGINPELEKESNPDDRVSKADYWFQKYNAMKTAGVDDEEIRDMYDELRINVAKAVFWQDAYATGLREKEDIRVRIVALGITPELLEKESNE